MSSDPVRWRGALSVSDQRVPIDRQLAPENCTDIVSRNLLLPEPPVESVKCAQWQCQLLDSDVVERQLLYWEAKLAGAPKQLKLPTDYPRPAASSGCREFQELSFDQRLSGALKDLSCQVRATLFMTLLAAWKVLLSRYSGQEDIVVGTSVPARNRPELDGLIGPCENWLALRTDLSANPTFRDLLRQVKEMTQGAYANRDLPFDKLVEEICPERNLNQSPLFQVMFALENTPSTSLPLHGVTDGQLPIDNGTGNLDLTVSLRDATDGLRGTLAYNVDLFKAETIARLIGHFQVLLAGIVADPDRPIGELPLLTDAERDRILVTWNQTARDYPREACVHELFAAQVKRTPEAVAIIYREQRVSYRELNERANRLAQRLIRAGVGPDKLVGICVDRSVEMLVGLLGVLKAGGAYVPFEYSLPVERLAFCAADARLQLILTRSGRIPDLTAVTVPLLALDLDQADQQIDDRLDPAPRANSRNLAYVIYTSGSTGQPKGVMIEHRGVVNYLLWCLEAYPGNGNHGAPLHSSYAFDLAVTSLFLPLLAGQSLVLTDESLGIAGLVDVLDSLPDFCFIKGTPAHLTLLNECLSPTQLPGCARALVIGGEQFLAEQVAAWRKHAPDTAIFNEYGPTETVVGSCVYCVDANTASIGPLPIGHPIANTQVYVLDNFRNPVPIGIPGELYIGGDGVARGYLNRPELTATKFVPDTFRNEPGARLYRTGDRVFWRPDGNLEFLGRIDHQIKLRGYRVELGEIEAVLLQIPRLREAVVLLREYSPEDQRIIAYVVPANQPARLTIKELFDFLEARLPQYMVPSAIVQMEALPLTSNGKVDRKALPLPESGNRDQRRDFAAPRNELEDRMSVLWTRVLHVDQVGIHDHVCDLGAHSLTIASLTARIRQEIHCDVSVKDLFEAPTIAKLSELVAGRLGNPTNIDDGPVLSSNLKKRSAAKFAQLPETPVGPTSRRTAARPPERDPVEYLDIIRPGETNAVPIVCVGDLRFNLPILRRMPKSVPVFFLKLDGCHVWPPEFMTVDDQLDLYIRALEGRRTRRQILLVGFSYGGFLAFRLATELMKRGWTDVRVLIFEPNVPMQHLPFWKRIHAEWRRIRNRIRDWFTSFWGLAEIRDFRELAEQSVRSDSNDIPNPGVTWNIMSEHYERISASARLDSLQRKIAVFGCENYHRQFWKCWEKIEAGSADRWDFPGTDDHMACFFEPFLAKWLPVLESLYDELLIVDGPNDHSKKLPVANDRINAKPAGRKVFLQLTDGQ